MTLFEETILKLLRKGPLDSVDLQERLSQFQNVQLARPLLLDRLRLMVEEGLVEEVSAGYRITKKGRDLLNQ